MTNRTDLVLNITEVLIVCLLILNIILLIPEAQSASENSEAESEAHNIMYDIGFRTRAELENCSSMPIRERMACLGFLEVTNGSERDITK